MNDDICTVCGIPRDVCRGALSNQALRAVQAREIDSLRIALETREEDLGQTRRDLEAMEAEVERLRDPEYEAHAEFLEERVGKLSAEVEKLRAEVAHAQKWAEESTEHASDLAFENERLRRESDNNIEAFNRVADENERLRAYVEELETACSCDPDTHSDLVRRLRLWQNHDVALQGRLRRIEELAQAVLDEWPHPTPAVKALRADLADRPEYEQPMKPAKFGPPITEADQPTEEKA